MKKEFNLLLLLKKDEEELNGSSDTNKIKPAISETTRGGRHIPSIQEKPTGIELLVCPTVFAVIILTIIIEHCLRNNSV